MSQAGHLAEQPVLTGAADAGEGLATATRGAAWQLSDREVEAGWSAVLEIAAGAALRTAEALARHPS